MEKINSENIISALFLLGFDKVDVLLYMCVLAKLTLNNQIEEQFTLEDEDFSSLFCQRHAPDVTSTRSVPTSMQRSFPV